MNHRFAEYGIVGNISIDDLSKYVHPDAAVVWDRDIGHMDIINIEYMARLYVFKALAASSRIDSRAQLYIGNPSSPSHVIEFRINPSRWVFVWPVKLRGLE